MFIFSGTFYLYRKSVNLICKILVKIILCYPGKILSYLPKAINILVNNLFYLEFTNYPLNRRRSINNNCFNVAIFKNRLAEFKLLCSIKYFEREFRLY